MQSIMLHDIVGVRLANEITTRKRGDGSEYCVRQLEIETKEGLGFRITLFSDDGQQDKLRVENY